jgi:hypothetical protein
MPRYAFGPFLLDPEARVLQRDGEPIPMAAKSLDTLIVLVQNRGRLVDKDELLSRVWAGSVVEEAKSVLPQAPCLPVAAVWAFPEIVFQASIRIRFRSPDFTACEAF